MVGTVENMSCLDSSPNNKWVGPVLAAGGRGNDGSPLEEGWAGGGVIRSMTSSGCMDTAGDVAVGDRWIVAAELLFCCSANLALRLTNTDGRLGGL